MQAYIVYFPTVLFSVFFIFDVHTNYLQLYFVSGSHSTPRSTPAEINTISQHSTLLILTYCAHWIVRLLTVVFFFPFRTLCEELSEQILGVAIRQQRPVPRKSRYFYFMQITIITQIELQISCFFYRANHDDQKYKLLQKSVFFCFASLIVSAHFECPLLRRINPCRPR